jgi:hypothetical protein
MLAMTGPNTNASYDSLPDAAAAVNKTAIYLLLCRSKRGSTKERD